MMVAAGRMGWTEVQFLSSTPAYFFAALRGHQEQERDRAHVGFAQARLVAYYAFIADDPKGRSGKIKISDIIQLPGDAEAEEAKFIEISQEDLDAFNERADAALQHFDALQQSAN